MPLTPLTQARAQTPGSPPPPCTRLLDTHRAAEGAGEGAGQRAEPAGRRRAGQERGAPRARGRRPRAGHARASGAARGIPRAAWRSSAAAVAPALSGAARG